MKLISGLQFAALAIGIVVVALPLWKMAYQQSSVQEWEYERIVVEPVKVDGPTHPELDDAVPNYFNVDPQQFDEEGKKGWEMCGVISNVETKYPPASGTQNLAEPNTRTSEIIFVFKRLKK